MGVSVYQSTFAKLSGNGNQTITGIPFQPKAVIFWSAGMTGTSFVEGVSSCVGFSDGTDGMSVYATSNDNVGTSDCLTATNFSGGTIAIALVDTTGTNFDGTADLTAFTSDGFDLTWTNSTATTYTIHYMAIGGTGITNVKVGSQTVAKSTTGNKSYTGVGFQPDFLLTANNGYVKASAVSANEASGNYGLGISAMKSTSARWAISTASEGGRATSDTWRLQQNTKCFSLIDNTTGTLTGEADFVSFDSDGFTWNYTTTGTNITNSVFIYIAIKGGVWDVGDHSIPAANSTITTNTDSSGTIKGAMLFNIQSTSGLLGTVSVHDTLSIGGTDGTRQSVINYCDNDGENNMVCTRIQSTSQCTRMMFANATAASSTTTSTGALSSFGTSDFSIAYTNSDTNARLGNYFALSELNSILYTRDITESSISVSDSNTRTRIVPRSISESSISVSDSNTRLLTAFRTISESSLSVSDSLTRVKTISRTINESSISVSDALARLLIATRAISESSISVSDSLSRIKTIIRSISESSISVSDALARLLIATRSLSESSISVSDALARVLLANRAISESSISVSDTVARILTAYRTISESGISVSDTGSDGHFLASRTISESSISVSDSLARLLIAQRSISESSISVSDSLARILLSVRAISESSISVSETLARTPIRVRNIDEDVDVSDSLDRYTLQIRSISESSISVSDSLARILIALRSISESSISVSETLARSTVLPRSITEPSISVSDSLARILYANRAISESSISVSDSLDRIKTIIRLISEPSISVSDSLARILIATRTLADTITVSDLVSGVGNKLRTISESGISVSDSLNTDETKLRSISETVIVSDSLTRRLSAFRLLSDTIVVTDLITGTVPVPVLAEYITDPGYTNPLRFRITWKSKLGDTTADESGDQIIYYQYDSFVPEARPFDIVDFSIRLTQGDISTASLTIQDFRELIDDPRKISKKSIVEVEFKKELGRDWERILTGVVRRIKTLRPAHNALMYQITILSKQVIDNERIINFKRAAKRGAVDSIEALATDANMAANKLFKEIYSSKNFFPRKNSPSVAETAEYDLETGSISDTVTDFITEIAPGLTTVAETTNQLTEGIGAIKGVDEFGNPYLRYPTEKHSGIIIKDSPDNLDSALNTSVCMSSFEFEDVIDTTEGFANRIYVLNSKDTKSTASSSKAQGFTTLTTRWIAQSFIADDNNVTAAAFILSKTGNPTNAAGTIKGLLRASSSNGNFPTGASLATFEISLSSLTNAKDTIFVNDIKTKDGVIVPGQRYWWVLQGTGLFDDTHTVNWHHDNDLTTTGRFASAKLPLVDTDPTKPGNQFNWIRSEVGPVYAFSTFSSINHVLVASDFESIHENGLIEAIVNLPAFDDDATYRKVLVKILKYSSKEKRLFDYTRVTIPTARLFKPGELVTVVDSKSKLDYAKSINAEIAEVSYNFDVNNNALGCKYVDLRLIGFIDHTLDDYLENKEC